MQAFSDKFLEDGNDDLMQTGRPSKHQRTAFGERLHAAREAAGLSQSQIAEKMGVIQSTYSDWERYPVAVRPDQIEKLARLLNVSVEYLFGRKTSMSHRGGPVGKARRAFEEVSKLSRHQQEQIIKVVNALVAQSSNGHKQAA